MTYLHDLDTRSPFQHRDDFLEYFNTNADDSDRSKDDAISESRSNNSYLSRADPSIPVVSLEGRMFPVEVCYLKQPCSDYTEAAVETVFNIHMKVHLSANVLLSKTLMKHQEPPGDILVFLTGREEIDQVLQQVSDRIPT